MLRATWTWLAPLLGALGVFCGILLATPPGFGAIPQVVLFSSRGPITDAAAYALGAASAFGLLTLVALGLVCGCVDFALRHRR